jgi:hypothetical protein
MDVTAQVVLLLMTVVLGSTLVVVGWMLFFVLKDVRDSLSRVNTILDDVETITERVSNGSLLIEDAVIGLHDIVKGFKDKAASPLSSLVGVITMLTNFKKGGEKNE